MFSKVSYVVAFLLVVCFLMTAGAQELSALKISPNASGGLQKQKAEMSAEEKVVRAAYEKLTRLNQATLYRIETGTADLSDQTKFLKFELRNFRIGPIQEILSAKHSEIITRLSGDTVEVYRSVSTLNKGEEHVGYEARWGNGQYASIYDPGWTVSDLMGFEAKQYYDVGTFALYDVKVFFQGKSREYRALALFHNPYGSVNDLKPTFWDSVGAGGALTQVWNEKRPPRSHKISVPTDQAMPSKSSTGREPTILKTLRHHPRLLKSASFQPIASVVNPENPVYVTKSSSNTEISTDFIESHTGDTRDHTSGFHGLTKFWKGSCFSLPGNLQSCRVDSGGTRIFENGSLNTFLYYHRWAEDEKNETATGQRGTPIACNRGHGLAVRYCINPGCTFTGALSGAGVSMQMTGGDVWNGQLVHRHTCNIPSSGAACTNTWTMQKCFSLGEGWNELTCRCEGTSPVIIDVNGDGFSLTNKAAGVSFDINADGQPEQIGWTANGSDDAWLFLDRNGNGVVDNGRELFGNFTPQPSSDDPNGFIALAEYDKPASGGNNDGVISSGDTVFASLRLWRDANHNGISEASELRPLAEFGIEKLEIDYKDSRRTDEYGNRFLYRAKVKDAQGQSLGRWAWDVFLVH